MSFPHGPGRSVDGTRQKREQRKQSKHSPEGRRFFRKENQGCRVWRSVGTHAMISSVSTAEVTVMNRRAFAQLLTRGALGATAFADPALSPASLAARGKVPDIPFKISVMLWTVFQDLPFERRLEKVAQAGYHYVELVGEYEKWSSADFQRINALRRRLSITFDCTAGLRHGLGNPAEREAFLADLRTALTTMQRIECAAIIVMSGNVVPGMTREAQHRSIVEGLKRAAPLAERQGATLLLENIDLEENPRYYLWSVAEGLRIIDEVGHPRVKLLYDFFHEQISEGNLIEKLEKNIEKVGVVHVADVPGRHEPGTGEINYLNIYRKLAKLNFTGYVAMEFIPTRDAVESLRIAREEVLQAVRS
jgi:hydroxypyruvate isomerase